MFSWSKNTKPGGSGGFRGGMSKKYTRQEHIASYLTDQTLKPSTRKINDTTYDTVFQTKDHHALILRVQMSSSLAIQAPKMTLVGIRAVHPWLDSKMKVVGYPAIQSDKAFVSSGILLSIAVNQVVQHFQLNPPSQLVVVDEGLKRLQDTIRSSLNGNFGGGAGNGNGYSANGNQPPPYGSQAQNQAPPVPQKEEYKLPPHFRTVVALTESDHRRQIDTLRNLELPKPPSTYPSQESLDRTKLTQMRDDPATHLVPDLMILPIVQETAALQHTMVESNSNLASFNLEKEGLLQALHSEVKDLQESLKHKMSEMNQLQRQQMDLCKPMDTKKILHKLTKAKKRAFEESEDLAMEWLEDPDARDKINEFLDRFLEVRTVHHVRAAKIERME